MLYYNVRYTAGTTVGYPVFLCVVRHFSFTAFLCDTISMVEEFLHSPRLPNSPTWIAPDAPLHEACSSDKECGIFSHCDNSTQPHLQVIHAAICSRLPLCRLKVVPFDKLGSQTSLYTWYPLIGATTLRLKVAI